MHLLRQNYNSDQIYFIPIVRLFLVQGVEAGEKGRGRGRERGRGRGRGRDTVQGSKDINGDSRYLFHNTFDMFKLSTLDQHTTH